MGEEQTDTEADGDARTGTNFSEIKRIKIGPWKIYVKMGIFKWAPTTSFF
jgi:hypothetical protein